MRKTFPAAECAPGGRGWSLPVFLICHDRCAGGLRRAAERYFSSPRTRALPGRGGSQQDRAAPLPVPAHARVPAAAPPVPRSSTDARQGGLAVGRACGHDSG